MERPEGPGLWGRAPHVGPTWMEAKAISDLMAVDARVQTVEEAWPRIAAKANEWGKSAVETAHILMTAQLRGLYPEW